MESESKKHLNWKVKLVAVLAGLYLVFILFGFIGVPRIARGIIEEDVAAALGRSVTVGEIGFNPFVLSAEVKGLKVADDWDGELAHFGRIYVNASFFGSIFGTPTLQEFQLEDSLVVVKREAGGALSFESLLESPESTEVGAEAEFELPGFRIGTIELKNISLEVDDQVPSDRFEDVFTLSHLVIHDLDTRPRDDASPLSLTAVISETATLSASASIAQVHPLKLDWSLALEGFDLSIVQPYVSELAAAEIDGKLDFAVDGVATLLDTGLELVLSNEQLLYVSGFRVRDLTNKSELVTVEEIAVEGFSASSSDNTVELGLRIFSPNIQARRLASGDIAFPKIFLDSDDSPSEEGAEGGEAPLDVNLRLSNFVVSGGGVTFVDSALEDEASLGIESLNTSLSNLVYGSKYVDADSAQLSGSFAFSNGAGGIEFTGALDAIRSKLDLDVLGKELLLATFQPYVSEYSNAAIDAGALSFDSRSSVVVEDAGLDISVSGNLSVRDLSVSEKGKDGAVLAYILFEVQDASYDARGARVGLVRLVEPAIQMELDEQGLNFSRLLKASEVEGTEEVAEVGEEGEASPFLVEVDRFSIEEGVTNIVDRSVDPAFVSSVNGFNLTLENLSTNSETVSNVIANARIDKTGTFNLDGEIRLLNPTEQARLNLAMDGIDLTTGSPLSVKYVGRKIDKGLFSMKSDILISDGQLRNDNNLRIEAFTFGEKVPSPGALKLPVGLAVAVMQDSNGVIAQNIPVRGDLTEPGVDKGALIAQAVVTAFTNIIVKAVTSPFKFLAGMAGGPDDIDTLTFDGGDLLVDASNMEKLRAMSEILKNRPKLKLEISGDLFEELEREALKKRVLAYALRNWDGVSPNLGLDTLKVENPIGQLYTNYNEASLRQGLLTAFAEGSLRDSSSAPAKTVEPVVSDEPAKVEEVKETASNQPKARIPVLSLLKDVLGRKRDKAPAEDSSGVAVAGEELKALESELDDAVAGEIAELSNVDLDSLLSLATQSLGDIQIDPQWLEALSRGRLQAVKELFITELGIDTSRVIINANKGSIDSETTNRGQKSGKSLIRFTATD